METMNEHISPLQKGDIHPDILTDKMLEDLRKACGADQILIIAKKDNTVDIRTFNMCGHQILHSTKAIIDFGLDSLEEETGEDVVE